jgi:hypothetical protein
MGLQDGRGRVARAAKDLAGAWMMAKHDWRDANAQRMEEQVLGPLDQRLKQAITAMDQMYLLAEQIKRECR